MLVEMPAASIAILCHCDIFVVMKDSPFVVGCAAMRQVK
jgi:hypothetical protein